MSIIGDIGLGFIETLVGGFLFIFQYIAGMLVTLGGGLVNFALDININQLGPETEIIKIGWQITRDVANLGFVLAIILIALATIVRFKEYGAKKLLPKLIGAALIVNFSLAIAGVFLDFSHTLTDFFINTQMQGYETVGENITSAFEPQKFYTQELAGEDSPPPDPGDSGSSFSGAFLANILGTVFSIAFTFLAFFTLAALSILLIIRFVYIAVLLIISPIAWLFWVIPGLEGQFKKWWDKFLQWTFFVPAVSFFIYLALVSIDELASNMSAQTVGSVFSEQGLANIITHGSQMIIVSGLMIGGLFAAQEIGIKGAKTALNVAEKTWHGKEGKGGIKGWSQRKAKRGGDRAMTAGIDEKGKTALERASEKYGNLPVVGAAFTGIAGASTRAKQSLKDQSKSEDDKYKDRTKSDVVNIANRQLPTASPHKAASLGIQAAKKGGWEDLSQSTKEKAIDAAKKTGREKDLMSQAPTTAPEFGKSIEEAMGSLDDITKLDKSTFNPSETPQAGDVVVNATFPQTDKLGKEGSIGQKQEFAKTLLSDQGIDKQTYNSFKSNEKALDKIKQQIKDAANRGDKDEAKRLQKQRDKLKKSIKDGKGNLSENAKKALNKLEHMEKKDNWKDTIKKYK